MNYYSYACLGVLKNGNLLHKWGLVETQLLRTVAVIILTVVGPVELQKPQVWQDRFFKQLAHPLTLLELFDTIPHVYMYIKDTESRFVRANRVVCDVVGVGHPDEVIGHTDFDFFPPAIAAQYVAEDQLPNIRNILKAAAITYFASALANVLNIGRWLLILRR